MAAQIELLLAGFTDSSGSPLNAGKIYTYEAGTTTPKDTYQDEDASTTHANPIILDSQGRKQAYGTGFYKFVIKDSSDNTLYTFDNLYFGNVYSTGFFWGGTSGFSSNAYTLTLNPAITSYTTGLRVAFLAGGANTGVSTLNINGLGAVSLRKVGLNTLNSGDLDSGQIVECIYDGTYFVITSNDSGLWDTWTPTLTGFSADPASAVYRYRVINKTCYIVVSQPNSGTSNATGFTITLPFTAATVTGMTWHITIPLVFDNSVISTTKDTAQISSAGSTITLNKANNASGWTNSGGKRATFQMFYEIA